MRKFLFICYIILAVAVLGLCPSAAAAADDEMEFPLVMPGFSLTAEGGVLTIETEEGLLSFQEEYFDDLNFEALILGPEMRSFATDYIVFRVQPKKIIVDRENPYLFVENGILYHRETKSALLAESTLERAVLRSDTKEIAPCAFFDCNKLTSVSLPEGLVEIKEEAFWCCIALEEIVLPASLEKMGYECFSCCAQLRSATFLSETVLWDGCAFSSCPNLSNVRLPKRLKAISPNAFKDCTSLTEIDLPDTLESIGEESFSGCVNLQSITFPQGLKEFGRLAFHDVSFETVRFPDGITQVPFLEEMPYNFLRNTSDDFREIGTAIYEGSHYDLDGYFVERIGRVIFLGKLPRNIAVLGGFARYTMVYYLDKYDKDWPKQWTEECPEIQRYPVTQEQLDALLLEPFVPTPVPTPTPTPTPRFSPTPVATPHSRLTRNPEAGTSVVLTTALPEDAAAAGDPVAFVLLGLIVCVGGGVFFLVRKRKR